MSRFESRDIDGRVARSYREQVDELEDEEFGERATQIGDAVVW